MLYITIAIHVRWQPNFAECQLYAANQAHTLCAADSVVWEYFEQQPVYLKHCIPNT